MFNFHYVEWTVQCLLIWMSSFVNLGVSDVLFHFYSDFNFFFFFLTVWSFDLICIFFCGAELIELIKNMLTSFKPRVKILRL